MSTAVITRSTHNTGTHAGANPYECHALWLDFKSGQSANDQFASVINVIIRQALKIADPVKDGLHNPRQSES